MDLLSRPEVCHPDEGGIFIDCINNKDASYLSMTKNTSAH